MDKGLVDFFTGGVNVVEFRAIASREALPNGVDRISIKEADSGVVVCTYWHNPNAKPKARDPEHPKNTGGKKPYAMLMVQEMERLYACDDSGKRKIENAEELCGWLVRLVGHIQWRTGLLIRKRSKKSLTYEDLLGLYGCSRTKLTKMLRQMEDHGLLSRKDEGYFVSRDLIKKGGAASCEHETNSE